MNFPELKKFHQFSWCFLTLCVLILFFRHVFSQEAWSCCPAHLSFHGSHPQEPYRHITCHMSHITCHMSHVTCHISHITCHISHVTCHMSHVTCHIIAYHIIHSHCLTCGTTSFMCQGKDFLRYVRDR